MSKSGKYEKSRSMSAAEVEREKAATQCPWTWHLPIVASPTSPPPFPNFALQPSPFLTTIGSSLLGGYPYVVNA